MEKSIEQQINELKKVAKENGLEVRFRSTANEQGDFCIYMYDKSYRKSYATGFDGDWNSKVINFDNCLKSAYAWIKNRDKRFIYRDGRWQYGRYHFIIWKDKQGSDMDHYLTIDDVEKAAKEYQAQGYCVVCYDETPEGRSHLAHVYGDYERHCNDYVKKRIRIFKYNRGDYGHK